jgi:hypothetical protein
MKSETPRSDALRNGLMPFSGKTTVTFHVIQWMKHSQQLERELNEANDKLSKHKTNNRRRDA